MKAWCQLLQEGTTHDLMLLPIQVHYSNRTSGKFSSILHTIPILHHVSIIRFPISQNFWSARVWKVNKTWKTLCRTDWKAWQRPFQQRHTKASPTIWKVPEFTAWLCRYQQVAKKILLLKFSEHFLHLTSSCSWTCYIKIILVPSYLNYTSNKFYFILLLLEVNSDLRAWRYGIQWILYIIHHTAKTNAHSILLILP